MSLIDVRESIYESILAHFPEWVEDDDKELIWDSGIDRYFVETDCEHGGHQQMMVEVTLVFNDRERSPLAFTTILPYANFLNGGLTARLAEIRAQVDFYEVIGDDLDDLARRMKEIVQEAGPGED